MSSFESSLRSSVKPNSPKPNSRKNKPGAVSTPLRQSLVGQIPDSGYKAAPLLVDRTNSVWEPPLSCQRSPISVLSDPKGVRQEQLYFPIELTSGEYVSKVYRLIASFLVSICKNKSNVAVRDNSINANVESFLALLAVYSPLISSNKLVVFNELKTFAFEPHMDLMLNVHAREVSLLDSADLANNTKILSETGKLVDMTTFYTSARALIEGLLQTSNSRDNTEITQCGQRVLHDLEHLEQQHKLHRVFKDQRMVAMGWLWPSCDAAGGGAAGGNQDAVNASGLMNKYNRSVDRLDTGGSNTSSFYEGGESKSGYHNIGSVNAAGPDVKRVEAAKLEAEEVSAQLRALLQPTTLATVQLFHRLVSIVQDLDVLMRALSADNEYQEAQRLRELKAVVDATITRQGRALLDQVKQCCTQAQLLAAELRHYCEDCKQRGAYYLAAQECESVARELLAQQAELRTNGVAPFSLLSQPSVVQRLQAEGSSFVTSNFLFSEPHLQQGLRVATTSAAAGTDTSPHSPYAPQSPVRQQHQLPQQTPFTGAHTAAAATGTGLVSIGSLLIRAGSNSVLNSILSTWPGLTALNGTNNSVLNSSGLGNNGVQVGASGGAPVNSDNNSVANGFSTTASFGSPSGKLNSALYHNNNANLSPVHHSSGPFSPYVNTTSNNTAHHSANPLHQSPFTFPDEAYHSFQPSDTFTGFNASEPHDPVGFSAVEHYNQVGFSPTILTVLMSFEDLQQQLKLLLSPASMALTALMQRLIGMSADLLHLSQRNHLAGQYTEGDRILALRAAVESAIDADLRDNSSELVCGRGRRRLDNLQVLLQQVQTGSRELQRLAIRSRSDSDFTGAQALDTVSQELVSALNSVERSLAQGVFSLLDSESGPSATENGVEINELIAREGTGFITSDYLFQFTSGREGHSIGSLAIVAGAGAVLRHIRAEWPHLTALSAPQYGLPQLPSHGEETQWATASNGFNSHTSNTSNTSLSGVGGNNVGGNVGNNGSVNGGSPLNGSNAAVMNFRDAASLRLLGFDAHSLRLAGFSDISIVTAGYTASELRSANFSTEQLRAAGLNESALRVVGYQVEQQSDVLASLYRATEGSKWTSSAGWRDLLRMRRGDLLLHPTTATIAATSFHSTSMGNMSGMGANMGNVQSTTLAQQLQAQQSQAVVLKSLEGVKCDDTTGDVIRLSLSGNNLKGQLPVGLGTLTSLTQLILSHNQLSGHLPACLGQLVHLENLHLDNNNFEGEVPKSLKCLEHLVVLKLENNKLTGSIPAVLGSLHRLRRLDLSNNQLTGAIPTRLTQLSQLQELLLFNNQLSGVLPETIGQWVNLTSLQLQNNCLQGYIPASIARLTKLTGINIQLNPDLIVDRLQLQRALPRCRIKM